MILFNMRAKPWFLQTRLYEKPPCPRGFSNHYTVLWEAYQTIKNVHGKLVSRKKELNFAFTPATKRFIVITPVSKLKEFSGKLALFQTKLIFTYNTINYMQNTTQNVFFSILVSNVSLFTFPHLPPRCICAICLSTYMCVIQK